jgi:hypothetical protein
MHYLLGKRMAGDFGHKDLGLFTHFQKKEGVYEYY